MNYCQLIDNSDLNRYEYHVDGHISIIEYMKSNNGEIFLTHTEVPATLRGRGIGLRLIRSVLEDIEQKKMKLIPLCPFIIWYINKNPQWKRLMESRIDLK